MILGVFRVPRVLKRLITSALLLGVFVVSANHFVAPAQAVAGINSQINFQGRLLNASGAPVADGNYNMQFKIYQDGTGTAAGNPGGTLKWTESYMNSASTGITVKNGYVSAQLGSITPFGTSIDWNQDTLWLSVNVGNTNATCTPFTSCAPDGEMLPMKRLSSTPFSLNSGMLGGKTAAQFLQLAQGVQTEASTNTSSIFINKTGSGGNFMQLQSAGTDVFTITSAGDIQMGANANHTVSVAAAGAGVAGKALTVSAGAAGAGGAAAVGGTLTLQGGSAAGTGNANGGDVTIAGGAGVGTGANGLVNLGASAYSAGTNPTCTVSCTVNQSIVDGNSTAIVSASGLDIVITLPAPTKNTVGRMLYVTTTSGSNDFTLAANAGADALSVTMRANTTATMIWNGTAWTPGGASNAITLQATYNNGTNPSETPEIKLDGIRGTIDIQDADTTIGQDILNVRGSNAAGLGTVLFGVSNSGRVTIQGTTDNASAFRVLNASGNYLFNINSSNNYVISNSIKSLGNEVTNPGFEAGGSLSNGEEGWFGPSQASIQALSVHSGNFGLQTMTNGTVLDTFAGNYFEVEAGESVYASGYVRSTSGANGAGGIKITWYNKDKTVLSSSSDLLFANTAWILSKVSGTAPAGTVYARISANVHSTATIGTYYFDDFYMKKNSEAASYTHRNASDSAAAFRIQSAGAAQTLFTANTTNNTIKIGDSTGSDTATTLLVVDTASVDPTTVSGKDGGMFYNSTTNSLKAVIGGAVVDICTTAVTCNGYSAAAGSSIQLQTTTPGTSQIGHFNITGTGILTRLQTQDRTTVNSDNLTITTGNSTLAGGKSGDLKLDVGTAGAGGTLGAITIGHAGVKTTMGGNLEIQGANTLTLGTSSAANGSILFKTSQGANTVTLQAPDQNPSENVVLKLPTSVTGTAGYCLKNTTNDGQLQFQDCAAGISVNLQDVYDNSAPANVNLASGKDFSITSVDSTVDPNVFINLQCVNGCGTNGGRFAVQNGGVDVLSVLPNGGGISLNEDVQIGSGTTDAVMNKLQLDSYNGADQDVINCTSTLNQGTLYYNTSMGSIRGCVSGVWTDISNPDTLGLLTFGIVPSSGSPSDAYDLPSLISNGSSGPCKVSRTANNTVQVNACTAYSNGRRVSVDSQALYINQPAFGALSITMDATNVWAHVCLDPTTGKARWSSHLDGTGAATANAELPAFSAAKPILCLADVQWSNTSSAIDNLYDVRTFSSTLKEAVITSSAVELGMLVDAGTTGAMQPGASASQKLYGLVLVADSANPTSAGAPNAIVGTTGPGWVKAIAGTAGQFIRSSTTAGYGRTIIAIPNNSFYFSAGNTRTNYSTACTTTSDCAGSLYVNFNVR